MSPQLRGVELMRAMATVDGVVRLQPHIAASGRADRKEDRESGARRDIAHPAPDQPVTTRVTPGWLEMLEKKAALRTKRLRQWRSASPSQRRTGRPGPSHMAPRHGTAQIPGLIRRGTR